MKKNYDIEMLRAVAILFVLFAHFYNLFPWMPSGLALAYRYLDLWVGVDLFFCVSGYIITASVLKSIPSQATTKEFAKFSIPFWIKRAWRLWPSAWIWLSFVTISSFIFTSSGIWELPTQNFMYQVYAMLHMANFYGFECKQIASCGANQVFWSLSIEEQFYLLFPVLMFIVNRKYWLLMFFAIFAIQFPLDRGGSILGFIRSDALAIGVIIALLQQKEFFNAIEPRSLSGRIRSSAVFGALIIALMALGNSRVTIVPFSTGMIAMVSGVMVWIASYDKSYLASNTITKAIAGYLGSRSYTLYLTHIPAFLLTKEIWWNILPDGFSPGGNYTFRYLATGIVLLFAFTEINYRLIETPLRNHGRKVAASIKERLA